MKQEKHVVLVIALAALLLSASSAFGVSVQSKTHLGGKASNLLAFTANVQPGALGTLSRVMPDGTTEPFEIPEGSVLVVTDVIAAVNGPPAAGLIRGGLLSPSGTGSNNPYFSFDATQQAQVAIHLTGGAVWSVLPSVSNAVDSESGMFVRVYGYLAKDK